MNVKEAIEKLKTEIKINKEVIKEARKNGDINTMELTADLDSESIAIETVLSELEKKDKIIDEMAKYMAGGNRYMYGTPEGIKEDFTKKCEGK